MEYSKKYTTDLVRVLTLENNRGKGGAIRMVSKRDFTALLIVFSTFKVAE